MALVAPISVLELPEFQRTASQLLSEDEILDVLTAIALQPEAGELMVGTGGLRKTRIALPGRGKSGGARVIYGYFGQDIPIFVFTCFSKNRKENLTGAERNAIRRRTVTLIRDYRASVLARTKMFVKGR